MISDVTSVGRFNAAILPPSVLWETYQDLLMEDPAAKFEALRAAHIMRHTPIDDLDEKAVTMIRARAQDEGKVGRRAPINPFHSPLLSRGKTVKKIKQEKVDDPALSRNPLRGRLIITISVNAALLMVYCQALVYNRLAAGYFYAPRSENSNLGPNSSTLYDLGGLNANAVRQGEWIRMFWSMWMHSGWLHIGLNILCQLQYFYMLEPDWGSIRTALTFWFSGISGNLLSMNMDPCKTTVGSSGGLFGLMGAVVPYCIEYWHSIPRPLCILIFSIFTVIITLATGLTKSTDTWAHVGGLIGGLLFGFGTITTPAAFAPKEKVLKSQVKRHALLRWLQSTVNPECKCGPREWTLRLSSLALLTLMWSLCFTYLLSKYNYQPLGSFTFSGLVKCCCCYDWGSAVSGPRTRANWHCMECNTQIYEDSSETWSQYCQAQIAE